MSDLKLPATIPTAWVIASVLAVLLFVVGIFAGASLFGSGSDDNQAVLEASQTVTTSVAPTPGRATASASATADAATTSPTPTSTPVITEPPPTAAPVAPAPTAPPQTLPPTAPPVTPAPTPAPPTPAPAPFASWPEAAQSFIYQGNLKFQDAATPTEQFVLKSCVVTSQNEQQRFYLIKCNLYRLFFVPGTCIPHLGCFDDSWGEEPLGPIEYRWWWDSGDTEQL